MSLARPDPGLAQRRAAAPGASVWVSASAGTGKTKVLTDRVVNLLLQGTEPTRILCLTFTKAAAAEMSNRLAARLGRWATAPSGDLEREIRDLTGELPNSDVVDAARRLFARVLDAPGGLKILTIHAFCQTVLARFPLESGVAPNFRVAEEREADTLLAIARNDVLRRAGSGRFPALADALGEVTSHVQAADFRDRIKSLIEQRGRLQALLAAHGGIDGVVRQVRAWLDLPPDADADRLRSAACESVDTQALLAACAALEKGSPTDRARAATIRSWLGDPPGRLTGLEDYRAAFLTKDGGIRATLATKAVVSRSPEAQATLSAEAARLLELDLHCRAATVAAATAAILQLGAAILETYAAEKQARGLLDYDDLILRTRDLLETGHEWVLYKLDGGLDHILIDESQDTNPEQWRVVDRLAAEFFAGQGARDVVRTLFAVGDDKQSIFSFQGADPGKSAAMHYAFRERSGVARLSWEDVDLDTSFRSVPAVLTAVDAVFRGPAGNGVVAAGAMLHHHPRREGQGGLVEVWPLLPATEKAPLDVWEPPRRYAATPSPEARLARAIADTVAGWLARREPLEARGRPIRAGDVMILVRRRTAFVEEVVKALKSRGVPVAGVDRMTLTEQLAVQDLMALGDFLLLPEDDLVLATVLKSPLIGIDEDTLCDLCVGRKDERLWPYLGQRAAEQPDGVLGTAHAYLAELLARADFVAPYDLFAEVLGSRGGRRRLLARLGAEASDPLDELLRQALLYAGSDVPSLQGFLHWLRTGEGEIKRDLEQGDRDEVRILTVHGAKGLEAPIVFLPDTTRLPRRVEGLLWSPDGDRVLWTPSKEFNEPVGGALKTVVEDRRDDEFRRLLYVAMTRAADRLYVCGWQDQAADGAWYRLVAEALAPVADTVTMTIGTGANGWSGEGLRLVSPQTAAPKGDDRISMGAHAAEPLPAWAGERVAAVDATRALAPSRAEEEEEPPVVSPLGADAGRRFRRGVLIHRLLQTLPDVAPADRAAACRRYLDRTAAEATPAARAAIAAECMAVVEAPGFAPLFAPDARAEVAISGMLDGTLVSGQVDRLCVTPTEVLIVDYKSNRPPPLTADRVSRAYLRQMAAYAALLRRVYPDRAIRCALLWTETPRLMPLPEELLDRHAPGR